MTIELTDEELKLVKICLRDKSGKMLANWYNPDIPTDLAKRGLEIMAECDELTKKLEALYVSQ